MNSAPPRAHPVPLISCVSENGPDWCEKVCNLLLSVRALGGDLAGAPIVVNVVDEVSPDFARRVAEFDADVRVVKRYEARIPTANKLRMLELADEYDFDVLVALDCDLLVIGDITRYLSRDSVRAAPESRDPFTRAQWNAMFEAFSVAPLEPKNEMSTSGRPTFPFFKSGVLFVPRQFSSTLRELWAKYIFDFDALCDSFPGRAPKRWFSDQAGLTFALLAGGLPVDPLPVAMNLSLTLRVHPMFRQQIEPPFVIHLSHQIDDTGFALSSRSSTVNPYLHRFNLERARITGLQYESLHPLSLANRLQMVAADRTWYQSAAVKRLRKSLPVKSLKKRLIG